MEKFTEQKNSIENSQYSYFAGLFVGLFCTINGFMFHIGGFNIRICDIPFFILPIYWLLLKHNHHLYYDNHINRGIILVLIIFLWFTISGFINFSSFNELYQENFIKYYINKTLWLPIYIIMYMMFGGKSFLYGVFYGISICALINVLLILYEWNSISMGTLPRYNFLDSLGIIMDEKKSKVINQDMIRPTGLMLDPNYTGGYTGIGIIFFDYLYRIKRKKIYIFLSIICIIPMFIIFSRTGLFSIIITFVISLIIHIAKSKSKNRSKYPVVYPWVIIIILIGSISILSYIISIDDQAYEMLMDRMTMNDSSAGVRTKYMNFYFTIANISQIFFGVGAAGFFLNDFWGFSRVWAPESSYITLLIEQGLLFFIFYIGLLICIFNKVLKRNYYWALILVYINLIGLSYNFLGDRLYFFLSVCFILFSFTPYPLREKWSISVYKI